MITDFGLIQILIASPVTPLAPPVKMVIVIVIVPAAYPTRLQPPLGPNFNAPVIVYMSLMELSALPVLSHANSVLPMTSMSAHHE